MGAKESKNVDVFMSVDLATGERIDILYSKYGMYLAVDLLVKIGTIKEEERDSELLSRMLHVNGEPITREELGELPMDGMIEVFSIVGAMMKPVDGNNSDWIELIKLLEIAHCPNKCKEEEQCDWCETRSRLFIKYGFQDGL